ncbi:MAG TPA: efflux RND transporter periplasmic adaptor subunit [Clostridia bacterium]|nr:efflux RND transporter periplasmic adaptor subunit [Clostridia bacterium]
MVKKVFLFVLLIILLISVTGCMSFFPKEDEMLILPVPSYTAVEYKTINPTRGDIVNSISILSTVLAEFEKLTEQKFSVNGYIDEIYVVNDQYVEKGDLIATLTDPENKEQIEEEYTNALNEYINIQKLYSEKSASEYQFRKAEINYNHAKEKYDEIIMHMNSKELRASQSGYIVFLKDMKKSDPIGKSVQLCYITIGQKKMINGTTTAVNAAKMQAGKSVIITFNDIQYQGYVLKSEGTNVVIGMDDMSGISVGNVVQVKMVIDEVYDVLKLPKTAVSITDEKTGTIRVLMDNVPTVMTIELGLSSGTEVEVLPGQGVDENTKVITGMN